MGETRFVSGVVDVYGILPVHEFVGAMASVSSDAHVVAVWHCASMGAVAWLWYVESADFEVAVPNDFEAEHLAAEQ